MMHKFSIAVGIILLAFVLISCAPTPPQVEVASTNMPPTETPAPTVVPTLDLSIEELNEQMFEAIRNDDAEQVALLIASGADLETRDPDTDATPLVIASYRGDMAVVETLLSAGADVNSADSSGFTALMVAAQSGHAALIPVLAEAGADLEALSITENQKAALHFAAKNGHAAVVEALLNAGADVNVLVKSTHSTALMNAAYQGHMDVVEILLEHGADTTVLDDVSHTASDWANECGFPEIAQMIDAAAE